MLGERIEREKEYMVNATIFIIAESEEEAIKKVKEGEFFVDDVEIVNAVSIGWGA